MCPFFTTGDTRTMTLASLTSSEASSTATVSIVGMTAVLSAAARFTLRRTAFSDPAKRCPTRKAARSNDHLGSKGEKPGADGPDLEQSGHWSHSFGELGIVREAIRYNQSCQLVLTRDNRFVTGVQRRHKPAVCG